MAHRVIDVIVRRMSAVMPSLESVLVHVLQDGVVTVVQYQLSLQQVNT